MKIITEASIPVTIIDLICSSSIVVTVIICITVLLLHWT
jgi:hypothetical protein